MTYPIDTSKTYLEVEGTETVTYYVKTGEGQYAAPATVNYAKRRVQDRLQVEIVGETHLVWHLWADNLGAIVPKVGDEFVDAAGARWFAQRARLESLAQRFRLECLKL